MSFIWTVAWRLLREGRFQTALILGGVTIGVGVIVYITAIVNGLQANIIERTLSSQAHVVLRPADRLNQAALSAPDGVTPLADVRKRTQRENTIANWTPLLHEIRAHPRVTASAVMASGPGVAQQGGVRKSVSLMGIELDDYQTVVRLDNKLRSGQLQLAAGEALIGVELAADLGLSPGSRLRLQSASGEQISVRVAATLDFGLKDLNRRWVLMPLRDAQNLLGYRLDITEIYVRTDQLFEAETLAGQLSASTGLTADSWQASNGQLVTALKSQRASSTMIRVFVTFAVALGIASVLVVSVVQKQKEIGILRAMGASRGMILQVFLIQGALVGAVGSVLGSLLAFTLLQVFSAIYRNADGTPLFSAQLEPRFIVAAALVATVVGLASALIPARRAARMDPVQAIRS